MCIYLYSHNYTPTILNSYLRAETSLKQASACMMYKHADFIYLYLYVRNVPKKHDF